MVRSVWGLGENASASLGTSRSIYFPSLCEEKKKNNSVKEIILSTKKPCSEKKTIKYSHVLHINVSMHLKIPIKYVA